MPLVKCFNSQCTDGKGNGFRVCDQLTSPIQCSSFTNLHHALLEEEVVRIHVEAYNAKGKVLLKASVVVAGPEAEGNLKEEYRPGIVDLLTSYTTT